MLWGWLIASVFALFIVGVLGEMCSVYPAVGGVYHWSAMYCPSHSWAPVFSYTCGWIYLLGCIAYDATLAQGMASVLASLFTLMSNGSG